MKTSQKSKAVLKEYISRTIAEDYDTSGWYDSSGLGGTASKGDLYSTFIKPFTDVIHVAAGKTKELVRRGITLLQVAFETVMTTLIPFLTDSYDEIFEKEQSDILKIRAEYKQYTDETWRILGSSDVVALAFMAFPGAALTGKFAQEAPDAAASLLSVATGGYSDEYLGGLKKRSGKSDGPRGSGIFDSYARSYSKILFEAEKDEKPTLADRFGGKKFVTSLVSRSPAMSDMAKQAQEIHRNTLASLYGEAQSVLSASSLDELEKLIGRKVEGVEDLKKLPPQEKAKAEKDLLDKVKESSKKFFIESIKKRIIPIEEKFGSSHPFVIDHLEVIAKIQKL